MSAPTAKPRKVGMGFRLLTADEVTDSTQFETSFDVGPDSRPRTAITTEKGYDSHDNRAAARARGITPVIPRRENSKSRGRFSPNGSINCVRVLNRPSACSSGSNA